MQRYAFCLISNTDHPAPPQPVQRAAYCVTLPVPVHSDHSDIAIGANYANKNDLEKSIHSNTTSIVAQNLCCIFELLTLKTYIDESIRRDLKTLTQVTFKIHSRSSAICHHSINVPRLPICLHCYCNNTTIYKAP